MHQVIPLPFAERGQRRGGGGSERSGIGADIPTSTTDIRQSHHTASVLFTILSTSPINEEATDSKRNVKDI